MMWYVGVLARLGTLRFWLNLGLLLAASYLAVATNLSAKKVPSEHAWLPWKPLFWSLVAAGVYVAVVAFYNYMRTQGAAEKDRKTDVNIVCQKIAWHIIDRCKGSGLDPGLLTVGVWL